MSTNKLRSSLAPKYEELAALYASNPDFASKVTVAKVDATSNDVPEAIQGFPTIKLYPAGSKDAPVDYTGSRTVEDLANFIRDHGKHGVDAYVAKESVEGGDVTQQPIQETATSSSSEKASDTTSKRSSESDAATGHQEL
jgi:protein disulfide-isomerase A1